MRTSRRTTKSFSEVLDNVIATAYERGDPITNSSKEIVIGDLTVVTDGVCYNVADKATGEIKYRHLYLIEAAFLIAKYIQLKDFHRAEKIINLEREYAKHYMDLMYHHNSCNQARINENFSKLDIYQMRYRNSKRETTYIKDKLRKMCDVILKKR